MSEEEPSKPDEPSADEAAAAGRARKKKGRRGRKALERSALDAAGLERPAFILDFPEDPELAPLIAAFEAGNYAYVRERAPRLAETSERADVKAAALELAQRIEPDPLVKFLLGVAIALFVVVVAYVYHSHGN
jgi:hypothetical protein